MQRLSGIVSVLSTTNSTSTSTGALIVSGGLGISGAKYIGGNLVVGAVNCTTGIATATTTYTPSMNVNGTSVATNLTSGSFRVNNTNALGGGIMGFNGTIVATNSIVGAFIIGGSSTTSSVSMGGGVMNVGCTVVSSNSTSGSVVIGSTTTTSTSVGLGGGNLYVGGTLSYGTFSLTSTSDSTSTSTGCVTVSGGVGVGSSLWTGTGIYLSDSGGTGSGVLLNYYETGTFNIPVGFSSAMLSNLVGSWVRIGNIVTYYFTPVSGAFVNSNTIWTNSGVIPTRLLPYRWGHAVAWVYTGGYHPFGILTVDGAGQIVIYASLNYEYFTGPNCGIDACTISWSLS